MKTGEGVVVVHPTAYDGAVELAGLQLGFSVSGTSAFDSHYKCAQDVVKSHLLQVQGSNNVCFKISNKLATHKKTYFRKRFTIGNPVPAGLEDIYRPNGSSDTPLQERCCTGRIAQEG